MKQLLSLVFALAASVVLLSCESQDRVHHFVTEVEVDPPSVKEVSLNDDVQATILVASDTLSITLLNKSNETYYTLVAVDTLQIGNTSIYPYNIQKTFAKGKHRLQVATSKGHVSTEMKGDTLYVSTEDVASVFLYDFLVK